MLLRLGDRMMIADRVPGGAPGPAHGVSGWGIPAWGSLAPVGGTPWPTPVGARYFCGDDYPMYEAQDHPCAQGNKFTGTKAAYQDQVKVHYDEEHPDLHYPIDQNGLDRMQKMKRQAATVLRQHEELSELKKWNESVGGGADVSSLMQPVARPRELADFTEFDFPDANLADDATEEIELDQLISIAARQGRRFLGVELQNLDIELNTEFLTLSDNADLEMIFDIQLNTRTGAHNLDDPENIWRFRYSAPVANVEATAGTGTAINAEFFSLNTAPPGGSVYVAPRLFWRFQNALDRQVDTGDLMCRIATVNQPLSTFLLFELLEQFSGLFGLT